MSNVNTRTFLNLKDAVKYAKESGMTHIVQIYINLPEYGGESTEIQYDIDQVENCDYTFFSTPEDANKFKESSFWMLITGAYLCVVNVQAYLDYHGEQMTVQKVPTES